jgi:hypothetical protein
MQEIALILGTFLVLSGSVDPAMAQSTGTRADCSTLDVMARAMQQARKACRDERFGEARALYDLVLSLGPIVGQASDE